MKIYTAKLLVALLFFGIFLTNCKGKKQADKAANKTVTAPLKTPDTLTVAHVDQAPDTTKAIEKQEAETIKLDNNLVKEEYYIIGGSFKELERAQAFEKLLKAKSYEAQVLKPYNGFNRVAIRAYKEETKARTELVSLRKVFNDVSFWLLLPY